MSLGSYLDKAGESGQEIEWAFSSEEIQKLYNLLKEIGFLEYRKFVKLNREAIAKYLSLSPSQRNQKKWVNHSDNLLIRFAALQLSNSTAVFQSDIYDLCSVVDGGSYRKFHAILASALITQHTDHLYMDFPFEGYDNPFFSVPK